MPREIRRARDAYVETDLRDRMARHHRDADAAFFGWNDVWLDPEFPNWSITDELERISCPLLLIQGERDQYGTMAQLDAIEQTATGHVCRLHLDCQHSPPTEMPDETVGAIAQFVSDLAPNAPDQFRLAEEPYRRPRRRGPRPRLRGRDPRDVSGLDAGCPAAPHARGRRASVGSLAGRLPRRRTRRMRGAQAPRP